jgi:ATP-dependent Lon protease
MAVQFIGSQGQTGAVYPSRHHLPRIVERPMTDKIDIPASTETDEAADVFPVLPLRDIVVFPHMIVPLFVGREKSIRALEEVMHDNRQILLVAQKTANEDNPGPDEIFQVGTVASVLQLLKLPDNTVKVLVEGVRRARVSEFTRTEEYYEARIEMMEEELSSKTELEAISRTAISQFDNYVKLNRKAPPEALGEVTQIEDYSKLADTIASHLQIKISEKQELLEQANVADRLERVYGLMESEISVLQVEKRIRSRVKRQMEKTQREYYLNEQMKAIQKELGGEGDEVKDELAELEEKIEKAKLSKEAREKAHAEM